MIRPAAFDYNPETAVSNAMQQRGEGAAKVRDQVNAEFQGFASALANEGIQVCVVEDTLEPPKPDAVFPNNWVSFHKDGTVVLYPMHVPSRQRERRPEVIEQVAAKLGYVVRRTVDLTHHERAGRIMEGTGSLVLDHVNRVAYAVESPRTHPDVVKEWAAAFGYEPEVFNAADRGGVPFYHTNVLMAVGERAVVVGVEAIDAKDRDRVMSRLRASGREIIEITQEDIGSFAGNMLELATWDEALGDSRVLVMSAAARHTLGPERFARLSACTDTVLSVPIPTIEKLGGGSVRCMMAEVFLPS